MGSNFQRNWISKYFQEGEKKRKEKKKKRKKKKEEKMIRSVRLGLARPKLKRNGG